MEQLIWGATQWRGHLAVLVCVVTAYIALRCLLAVRQAPRQHRQRLLACGLAAGILAPLATFPGLGILPALMAVGLGFLAATGVPRKAAVKGGLVVVGMSCLALPTALLASGIVVGLGSGPSMWPTTSKGLSVMFIKRGQAGMGRGSQVDFLVEMSEAGQDPETQWPAGSYHKRIIGMPGDHVVMDDYTLTVNGDLVADCLPTPTTHRLKYDTWLCDGRLSNGTEQTTYQLTWGDPEIWMDGRREWTLGDQEVLVFGDNLVESGDSRHRGPIPIRWIVGMVVDPPDLLSWLNQ